MVFPKLLTTGSWKLEKVRTAITQMSCTSELCFEHKALCLLNIHPKLQMFSNSQRFISDVFPKRIHRSIFEATLHILSPFSPLVSTQIEPLVHWPSFWTPSGIGCRLRFYAAWANLYPYQKRTLLSPCENKKSAAYQRQRQCVQTIWQKSQSSKSYKIHLTNE